MGVGFDQSPYAGINHHMVPQHQHHAGVMQAAYDQQQQVRETNHNFILFSNFCFPPLIFLISPRKSLSHLSCSLLHSWYHSDSNASFPIYLSGVCLLIVHAYGKMVCSCIDSQ